MSIHLEEKMLTGVPAIDEQHEEIFAQFNKLSEALNGGIGSEEVAKLLSYLNEYVSTHFSDEENLMSMYRYPGLDEQRQHHALFKENIALLTGMLADNAPEKEIAIKLDATLIRYFINHVRTLDCKMADFIKSGQTR